MMSGQWGYAVGRKIQRETGHWQIRNYDSQVLVMEVQKRGLDCLHEVKKRGLDLQNQPIHHPHKACHFSLPFLTVSEQSFLRKILMQCLSPGHVAKLHIRV